MRKRLVALLACIPVSALAHDFWIEPSTFRPAVGTHVELALRVGVDFAGDPVGRSSQLIESFTVRDAAGERPVPGIENRDPAGILRIERAGGAVVGYRSRANALELPADKFEHFLREEGLERIIELRAKRGESRRPGREHFYRYAKSLLGTPDAARPLGFRLEIVADGTVFRVLFEGKPLHDVLVVAMHRDDPRARSQARSGRDGRVALRVDKPGVWLIKAVHIVPARAGAGADWESLWASLTFER